MRPSPVAGPLPAISCEGLTMCRANSQGGRRCKGCQATAARDAHNFRRRLNRAIKAEALERAQAAGMPTTKIAILKKLPPGNAKQWALENGLAPGNTGRDIPPAPQPADTPAAPPVSGPAARFAVPLGLVSAAWAGRDVPRARPAVMAAAVSSLVYFMVLQLLLCWGWKNFRACGPEEGAGRLRPAVRLRHRKVSSLPDRPGPWWWTRRRRG